MLVDSKIAEDVPSETPPRRAECSSQSSEIDNSCENFPGVANAGIDRATVTHVVLADDAHDARGITREGPCDACRVVAGAVVDDTRTSTRCPKSETDRRQRAM